MNRKIIWGIVALVLIAAPAVLGLALLGGDSDSRRAGALIDAKAIDDTLVISGITPLGKAIAVDAFNWGVTQSGYATSAGGAIAGKATFQDFAITKTVDETSTKLALNAANGKHIPEMTLTVMKAGTVPSVVMTYKFTDVIVTSVQQSHARGSGNIPVEQVSFNYSRFEMTVNSVDPKGTTAPGGKMMWDLRANTGS